MTYTLKDSRKKKKDSDVEKESEKYRHLCKRKLKKETDDKEKGRKKYGTNDAVQKRKVESENRTHIPV